MTTLPSINKCYCSGEGKYADWNCGQSFFVQCPHCLGSGTKKCECDKPGLVCVTFGRGVQIVENDDRDSDRDDDFDNAHWMFMD